jgi:RND family efflux transporter MFP subunit
MSKKLIISIIAAITIIGSGIIFYQSSGNGFETYKVSLENIENKTTLVGTVKANQDLDLGFEVGGKISKVNFNENQTVSTGDLIIELNKSDLYAQRVQASANLKEAQSSLKQQEQQVLLEEAKLEDLKSGGSNSEILVAERNVDLRKEELNRSKTLLEQGLQDNSLDLENELSQSKAVLESSLNQAISSLYSLTDLQFDIYPREDFESIRVGFHKAKAAEILVGVTDSSRFTTNTLSSFKNGLLEKSRNIDYSNTNEILEFITDLKIGFNDLNSAYLYFTIDSEVSDLTINTLNSEKNTVSNQISSLNLQQQEILNTIRNIDSNQSSLESNILVAEKSLEQAKSDLERVRTGADENDLKIQEISIEQARSLLESRQASVQFQFGRIAAINADISKRNIVAPIDGVIVDLEFSEGEIAAASEKIMTLQAENDLLIEIDSPERYISFLKDGQDVEVVLDAFSKNTLMGKVVKISQESTLVDNVPVFKVDISLDADGLNVKSGMTGDVILTLEKDEEAITVPAIEISKEENKSFVNKVTSKDPLVFEKIEVEIGIRGTNGKVQIIDGVTVGDEILINQRND